MLALLMAIALSGLGMKYLVHTDIIALKAFFLGLMVFDWQPLPADLGAADSPDAIALPMIVFPISKLLHAPGCSSARRVSRWTTRQREALDRRMERGN